jgi:carbon storage regulator
MLVISRRIGESFVIGDDITATVVDITGEKVVLGLEAPKSVQILRVEPPEGERPEINERGYGRQYKRTTKPPPKGPGKN